MAEPAHDLSVTVVEDELGFRFGPGAALLDRIWYVFSSIKFALGLLLLLTIGSFVGLLIPQHETTQFYLLKYGEFWKNVILFWNIDNTFFAWWYVTMEVLIGASIVVCSINRMPIAWRMAFETTWLEAPRAYEVSAVNARVDAAVAPDEAERRLLKVLRAAHYRVRRRNPSEPALFSGSKGQVSRLLPYVIHIGLEIMLLGGVVGALASFSTTALVPNGSFVKVPGRPDDRVRVDSFQVVVTPKGDVKDYITWATIFEGGRPPRPTIVRVNHPLVLNGVHYYQATFARDPDRIELAELRLVQGPTGAELRRLAAMPPMLRIQEQLNTQRVPQPVSGNFRVLFGERTAVPGTPYAVRLIRYVTDFGVNPATREVFNKSQDPNNPAALVELWRGNAKLYEDWVFLNSDIHLEPHEVQLQLLGFKETLITGFQVARNPGAPLLLVGFIFFAAGLAPMMVLYTHRQVWARVDHAEGGSVIRLAGRTYKNKRGFEQHFRELTTRLAAVTGAKENA